MTNYIPPLSHIGVVYHGTERRQLDRASVTIQAILRFPDRLQVVQGSICDLSIGGTGFICHQAITAHTKCSLQFMLPAFNNTPSHALNMSCIAISSMQVVGQAYQFRVNLQFIGIAPNVRNQIEAFIRQSLTIR